MATEPDLANDNTDVSINFIMATEIYEVQTGNLAGTAFLQTISKTLILLNNKFDI